MTIFKSCETKNIEFIQNYITSDNNISAVDYRNQSPLHHLSKIK